MARQKKVDRPVEKSISIPSSIHNRVELLLVSPLEGKVPHGAWSGLVTQLLKQYLQSLGQGDAA